MGLGGISIWQLLIILAIVVMLFRDIEASQHWGRFGKRDQRLSRQHEARHTRVRHRQRSVEREESPSDSTGSTAAREERPSR